MDWLIIAPIAGLTSIAFAIYLFLYVNKQKSGTVRIACLAYFQGEVNGIV